MEYNSKSKSIKNSSVIKFAFLFILFLTISFSAKAQTSCSGPFGGGGTVGEPGLWKVIGNVSNGSDYTGYGNVSYEYSYMDRFVRIKDYLVFLNSVDPSGFGSYVGNLVNFDIIQYSGYANWTAQSWNSCSSQTGQSMSVSQTEQLAATLISFNHAARFCNWLSTGNVNSGPYTFSSSSSGAGVTSVNISYPNGYRMPTENEFYKAAYYRASFGSYVDYGTQNSNLNGSSEPIVSNVSSTGIFTVSNGHLYNQTFHSHPTVPGFACLWQMRAGQGGQSYYGLYNMVGGFHHYLTENSSGTMVLRPQNQVQGGAAEQSRNFRLTGADPAEAYASPSFHLVFYGDACCPVAGTPTNVAVCDDNFTTINLYSQLTGEDTGGTWTRLTGTGGTFNAASGTFLPASGTSASNTFRYTIAASGACAAATADVVITITHKKIAGTGGSVTECTNSGTVINLASLLTGAETGGAWTRTAGTGGTFNAAAGTFTNTGTVSALSTFRYRLTNASPCTNSDATVTLNVVSSPNAGNDSSTSVCDNSVATINLINILTGEDSGGTWTRTSGTGGTFNAASGTFVPAAGATTSVFTYTVGGGTCPVDMATVTVTITPQAVAGTGGSVTDCAGSNNTITLSSLIIGGQTGGTWSRLTGTGGTFTGSTTGTFVVTSTATTSTFRYTVAGTSPCANSTADVTVTITGAPKAGTGSSTSVCDNSVIAINLYNLLAGEDTGGVWTRTSGTGGTFTPGTGMFTPAVGATTSVFTYTIGGSGCPIDTEDVTVTLTPQAVAGTGGSITDCAGSNNTITLSSLITGGQTGGSWTRLTGTGGTFTGSTTGTYVITTNATTSTFRYTVTGTSPCLSSTADVTVTITAAPKAGTGSSTSVCDNSMAAINLFNLLAGEDAGGVWTRASGTGGTFTPGTGMFTPAVGATTSVFTYTNGGSGCPIDTEDVTVTLTPQAVAGSGGSVTDCAGSNNTITLSSLITGGQTGGTWSRLTGTGGTFTGSTTGTYVIAANATTSTFRYTVAGTSPCANSTADVTVTVTAAPMAGTGSSTSVCDDSSTPINLFNLLTGEDVGGVWTRISGTGGTFTPGTGMFTPAVGATTSVFTYTNGGSGCPIDTENVTVNITPRAYAGVDGTTEDCEGGGIVINLFEVITGEQPGGTWTRLTGTAGVFNAAAGTYSLTTGADNSTFRYTRVGTGPCANHSSVATVNVTGSCCVINSVVLSNLMCLDNSTPGIITDNKIRFSILVTNQNPLLNTYNVSVNGGTTITPGTGQYNIGTLFTLGSGSAGGGATFIVTITDALIPGCTSTVSITDPGNCSPALPDCPTIQCGTANIQVNGN